MVRCFHHIPPDENGGFKEAEITKLNLFEEVDADGDGPRIHRSSIIKVNAFLDVILCHLQD